MTVVTDLLGKRITVRRWDDGLQLVCRGIVRGVSGVDPSTFSLLIEATHLYRDEPPPAGTRSLITVNTKMDIIELEDVTP